MMIVEEKATARGRGTRSWYVYSDINSLAFIPTACESIGYHFLSLACRCVIVTW